MENRYRTNLKKVFLTDQELATLNDRIGQSGCKNFSAYARKVLLNPNMTFLTIDTSNYEELVFELKRIGNNLNQIARTVNFNTKRPWIFGARHWPTHKGSGEGL